MVILVIFYIIIIIIFHLIWLNYLVIQIVHIYQMIFRILTYIIFAWYWLKFSICNDLRSITPMKHSIEATTARSVNSQPSKMLSRSLINLSSLTKLLELSLMISSGFSSLNSHRMFILRGIFHKIYLSSKIRQVTKTKRKIVQEGFYKK